MKNNIDPKSILLYLSIIAFVLIYNKTGSGNTEIIRLVSIGIVVGYIIYALAKYISSRKK